jgi:hypothetical protein
MPRTPATHPAPLPPHAVLTNGDIRLTAFIPDLDCGFYRGVRFDRGVMLHDVAAHGRRYYTRHREEGSDPTLHDAVTGPAEEFDIDNPQTYDLAPVGGAFLKIGVGVLKRTCKGPYRFARPQPVLDPGAWRTVVESAREMVVEHRAALPDGSYGYELRHRVALPVHGTRLRIERTLLNTGRRKLTTFHYNHNFARFDELPVGPDYRIETPFKLQPLRTTPEPGLITGRRMTWTTPLRDAFYMHLTGHDRDTPKHHAFTIRHAAGGAIRYATDAPLEGFRVYATPHVICPEPFTRIDVAAGKSFSWNTQIAFEE